MNMIKSVVKIMAEKPQKLFLFDAFGALLSITGLILIMFFAEYFGLSKNILSLIIYCSNWHWIILNNLLYFFKKY